MQQIKTIGALVVLFLWSPGPGSDAAAGTAGSAAGTAGTAGVSWDITEDIKMKNSMETRDDFPVISILIQGVMPDNITLHTLPVSHKS